MISKRTNPMIGRLSELLVSGHHRAGILEMTTSPRSQSPRGLKNYDAGGVGLGIVAALEKSSNNGGLGHEILAKYAICSTNMNRSNPIPVKNSSEIKEMDNMDSLENYTYVTSHGPDKSLTKVYYHDHGIGFDFDYGFSTMLPRKQSPARFSGDVTKDLYPTSDFLSSCNLCKKKLHGKDIYMYRGERAFCSIECRSRQIMIDERKEQCRSKVSRSADVSTSPYTTSPIFSTGILAI